MVVSCSSIFQVPFEVSFVFFRTWTEKCDKSLDYFFAVCLSFCPEVKLNKSYAGKIGSVVHCVREAKERGSDPKTNILEPQNDGTS